MIDGTQQADSEGVKLVDMIARKLSRMENVCFTLNLDYHTLWRVAGVNTAMSITHERDISPSRTGIEPCAMPTTRMLRNGICPGQTGCDNFSWQ